MAKVVMFRIHGTDRHGVETHFDIRMPINKEHIDKVRDECGRRGWSDCWSETLD